MDLARICQAALDLAGVGVCIVDCRQSIAYLNSTGAELLGCPADWAVGRQWSELLGSSGPGLEPLASLPTAASDGGPVQRRLRLTRGDAEAREVDAGVWAVADGDEQATVLLLREIPVDGQGSAGEWEQRFRGAPDITFVLRADGQIVDANVMAAEAYGYSHAELLGMGIGQLRVPATTALLPGQMAGACGEGGGLYETMHVRRDGSRFPVEVRLAPVATDTDGPLLGIVRDLTSRRRGEEARRTAAIGQLAAGVSHEMNNVLASMVLQAERAALKDTLEAYRKLAELVPRAVARGTGICRNLMSFSRPPEAERQEVGTEQLVEAALSVAAGQLGCRGIMVTRRWAPEVVTVLVAPAQVQQALLTLIDNACDAMPDGGELVVRTAAEQGEDGRNWSVVEISDTGVGIAAEHLPQVFAPFFTTKARIGEGDVTGIGLGLSVSRSIIAGHGGRVSAQSEPGVGSSFTIRLPAASGEAASAATQQVAHPLCARDDAVGGLRLLLVDDDEDLRQTLAEGMSARGYSVATAGDGREGAAAAARGGFDVIVTDLMMPAGGGAAVIEAASALPARPVIVVITGRQEPSVVDELAALGVREVLRKPFRQSQLVKAIETSVKR